MTDTPLDTQLWTPRSVEETQAIYRNWADGYDGDMARMRYATPLRVADALCAVGANLSVPVLDFGCGTGLSGQALVARGFATVDGTDISPEMLEEAQAKKIYRDLWLGTPGQGPRAGDYAVIVATGVISLGAAPPEILDVLLDTLAPEGLLAFSFNDPTLANGAYLSALERALDTNAEQLFREHGPHLSEKVTGSDVIVLRRR